MMIDTSRLISEIERIRDEKDACGCISSERLTGLGYAIQVIKKIEKEHADAEANERGGVPGDTGMEGVQDVGPA